MNGLNSKNIIELITEEGWKIVDHNGKQKVEINEQYFPVVHPYFIYGKLYRTETIPAIRSQYLKRLHDILWPQDIITWNHWTERRFKIHAEGWKFVGWSSGGHCGKSYDAAKIAIIEWTIDPKGTGILVVSTTMESVKSRVYGYILRLLKEAAIPLQYTRLTHPTPKIMYDKSDDLHSITVIAAPKGSGEDEKKKERIKNYIGRHPKRKFILLLDECPDLDPVIVEAVPNLELGDVDFQLLGLGNADSRTDLHGGLCTPKDGWGSVHPDNNYVWETSRKGGICLFFDCYDSPAIRETDPEKKKALSRIFLQEHQIREKELEYGSNSEQFWRFVRGFWRESSTDPIVVSEQFLNEAGVNRVAEWSGLYPMHFVAGLDPAFSTGGDSCVLRLGILGHTTEGKVVLDFKGDSLLFRLAITANSNKSADLQIAEQVIEILNKFKVDVGSLAVDATGQGRGLAEVIRLKAGSLKPPLKIYSTKVGHTAVKSFDVIIKTSHDLWFSFRDFMSHGQIQGLDKKTYSQLSTRRIERVGGKQVLESKAAYKTRMGSQMPSLAHSPDEADAASLALQSAILLFGFTPGQFRSMPEVKNSMVELNLQAAALEEQKNLIKEKNRRRVQLTAGFSGSLADYVTLRRPF